MDNDLHKPTIGLPSTLPSSEEDIKERIARGPPTSAEDYLLRVRLEANSLPNVFRASPKQLAKIRSKKTGHSGENAKGKRQNANPPAPVPRRRPSKGGATTAASTGPKATPAKSVAVNRTWTPTSEGFAISKSLRIPSCPPASKPSEVWARGQLKNFADLRQYLNFWAAHYRAGTMQQAFQLEEEEGQRRRRREQKTKTHGQELGAAAAVPPPISPDASHLPRKTDEKAWMIKCVGSHFDVASGSLVRPAAAAETGDGDDGANVRKVPVVGTAPTVGLLIRLDNVTCCRVLGYHVRALSELASAEDGAGVASERTGHYLTDCRAAWIYALLARIDLPVPVATAGYIRDLLRLAAKERSEAQVRDERSGSGTSSDARRPQPNLAVLNLLILLAERYFGQSGPSESE